jgi:16S rRNA (guanine527-N7)-methyltransferase
MAALTPVHIAELLKPYLGGVVEPLTGAVRPLAPPAEVYDRLGDYLDLLLKWNARTNLTSIREPEAIVQRHFGESLFAARFLESRGTLLDFGSGAGFPGLPIALVCPEITVTLAESQGKKAAFLREALRVLGVEVEMWDRRVEAMPPERGFDVVALRAVDSMERAILEAGRRASGRVLVLATQEGIMTTANGLREFRVVGEAVLPACEDRRVGLFSRR